MTREIIEAIAQGIEFALCLVGIITAINLLARGVIEEIRSRR